MTIMPSEPPFRRHFTHQNRKPHPKACCQPFSTSPFFRAGRCRKIGSWLRHRLEGRWLRIMPVC
ncbi:hypothetical protein EEE23_01810 [Neisseria gonorrhoeae]